MVLSCMTIYAVVLSCMTLLIGRSCSATAIQVKMTVRQSDRRGTKLHLNHHDKPNFPVIGPDSIGSSEKLKKSAEVFKIPQNSFIFSNLVKSEKPISKLIPIFKKSHPYLARFDPESNLTKKFEISSLRNLQSVNNPCSFNCSLNTEALKTEIEEGNYKEMKHLRGQIKNFVIWDTLQDSEMELRVHYNGITAKETVVNTGINKETGERQGLKLRQLSDGVHLIQLIYSFDNQIQDCEYLKNKKAVRIFLNSFKQDIEKAKRAYDQVTEQNIENLVVDVLENEDYIEEDEGKIESYHLDESETFEEEEEIEFENKYRNVTFHIINRNEDLPVELAEWMDYPILKEQCRKNHKILKELAFNRKHGSEEAKIMAESHIERAKRGLDFSLIFPGTKWCGKNHLAEKYTALGGFWKTDKCCRNHDYCHPFIGAFQHKYDFYNFQPYTLSHCHCDLRRKRDVMNILLVPGTKWCGKGRAATKYTSLGGFSRTDKCCRIHDTMCPHWIGSLEEKYGLFNWRINTIMHCRCDKRFRACLKMAKTGTANFVGKLFFNVIQTKCFVLKPQEVCLKHSWWGNCEKKEYRKKAYLKDNLSY